MEQQDELEIEMRIWEYLDGLCSAEEQQHVLMLIEQDAAWKTKYNEIVALHATIGNHIEQEHPAMRFTQNVMDVVAKETIAPAAKSYLNKWVIRGIAAFFICIFCVLMVNTILGLDWSGSNKSIFSGIKLDWLKTPSVPFNTLFYGFGFLNVVAGLILLDSILKKKKHHVQNV